MHIRHHSAPLFTNFASHIFFLCWHSSSPLLHPFPSSLRQCDHFATLSLSMSRFNPDNKSSDTAYTQLSDLSPSAGVPPPASTPTVSLPPGWTEYFTKGGLPYYVNSQTNVTQWTAPKMQPPPPPGAHSNPPSSQAPRDSHALQINEPKVKVNRVQFPAQKGQSEQHVVLLSPDLPPPPSQETVQMYDETNVVEARCQYDHVQPYNCDPNYGFLETMSSTPQYQNTTSRNCEGCAVQSVCWISTAGALACLIVVLVGFMMPYERESSGDMVMTGAAWDLILYGGIFWPVTVLSVSLTFVKLCIHESSAWDEHMVNPSPIAKALLFGFTCCMSTPIHKTAGWTTQDDFNNDFYTSALQRTVPTLTLKFEGESTTSTSTLSKTITVPIVGFKDISPARNSPISASLVDITFHHHYTLPTEQRHAIDYIKKVDDPKMGPGQEELQDHRAVQLCNSPWPKLC